MKKTIRSLVVILILNAMTTHTHIHDIAIKILETCNSSSNTDTLIPCIANRSWNALITSDADKDIAISILEERMNSIEKSRTVLYEEIAQTSNDTKKQSLNAEIARLNRLEAHMKNSMAILTPSKSVDPLSSTQTSGAQAAKNTNSSIN